MKKQKLVKKVIKVRTNEKKTIVIKKSGLYVVELVGEGANVKIAGWFEGKNDPPIVVTTVQHHKVPHTPSDLLIKIVISKNSSFIYRALIKIDKKAQRSNAYQRNENLLLSKNILLDSKPDLEIQAHDVRCTHAVTAGMSDVKQLFYLQSRGISKIQSI